MAEIPRFNIDLLSRQVRHKSLMPEHGVVVASADTAFSDGPRSDRSVLVAGKITAEPRKAKSELWLFDVIADKIPPRELPTTIAKFVEKHEPSKSVIEAVNGSEFLRMLVEQEALRMGINPHIEWLPAHRQSGGKVKRIEKLIRLHHADRLHLVSGSWVSDFIGEAERWTGTVRNSSRHDDEIDAASMLCRYIA